MQRDRDGPDRTYDSFIDYLINKHEQKELSMAKKKSKKKASCGVVVYGVEPTGNIKDYSADEVIEAFSKGLASTKEFDLGVLRDKFQSRMDACVKRLETLLRDMQVAAKVLNKKAADKAAKIAAAKAFIENNS